MNFPPVSASPAISRQRRKIAIFGIFSSCAQTKQNFGKLFVVFERQLSGLLANAIRDYARSLFTHLFMPKLKSFGVAPTSTTIQTFNEHSRMAKLSQPYLRGHKR